MKRAEAAEGRRVGDQLIRLSMTVIVIFVAAVAGWVSYWHAVEVVERYGAEREAAVYLIPLTIDGMIYASSMAKLWAVRYGLKPGWLSQTALVVGIAATLVANVLQGLEYGPLAAAIAAWPAVALIISYELAMWVVRSAREIADRPTCEGIVLDAEENQTGPAVRGESEPAETPGKDAVGVEEGPGNLATEPVRTRRRAVTAEEKVAQVRERLGQARQLDAEHRASRGRPISADNLAKAMRISKSQALVLVRTIRQEIAQEVAHNLAHPAEPVGKVEAGTS
ncbi:hypothetical protein GCM10022221_81810 [Actinocorallia aurea]